MLVKKQFVREANVSVEVFLLQRIPIVLSGVEVSAESMRG